MLAITIMFAGMARSYKCTTITTAFAFIILRHITIEPIDIAAELSFNY